MTAKEKAEELFNIHYFILLDADSDISQEILISSLAKKMALVTIEEIITSLTYMSDFRPIFWRQVKQEIEKL